MKKKKFTKIAIISLLMMIAFIAGVICDDLLYTEGEVRTIDWGFRDTPVYDYEAEYDEAYRELMSYQDTNPRVRFTYEDGFMGGDARWCADKYKADHN